MFSVVPVECILIAEISRARKYLIAADETGIRVVNSGIPDDFGIVKSLDLNFGIIQYRNLLIGIPALPGLTSLIK
jgi:hypothetical protein